MARFLSTSITSTDASPQLADPLTVAAHGGDELEQAHRPAGANKHCTSKAPTWKRAGLAREGMRCTQQLREPGGLLPARASRRPPAPLPTHQMLIRKREPLQGGG